MKIASNTPVSPRLGFTDCLKRQAAPDFVAGSVEAATKGLKFCDALRLVRPEDLRATEPDRVNPASDALLLNLVDKLPRGLAEMTWGAVKRWVSKGDATPQPLLEKQSADFKVGKEKPLDEKSLTQTLSSVMAEFPELSPHIGPEHKWSKEGLGYQGLGYWKRVGSAIKGERPFPWPTSGGSKLLCSLGLGATSVTMPTGKEKELHNWIVGQKDASVELHSLFRESYKLNKGDLYGTLLTAENVLSEGLYDADRQDREVTTKLSYLRSDSSPGGDNFGCWYHLFGAALYSLVRPEWKSTVCLKIEDIGSYILEGADPQEDHINQLGKNLGISLRDISKNGLDRSAQPQPYVNLGEYPWDRHTVRS